MSKQFKPTGIGNEFVEMDDFSLSFNPSPFSCIPMFQGDTDDGETAIIKDGKYFILNGDFRDEYLKRETFDSCIEFYLANPDKHSSWSDTYTPASSVS